MFDYTLRFETEQQANDVLNPLLDTLHPSQYVKYTIGQITQYDYDEDNPDTPPTATVVSDKWHVDLRLRTAISELDEYHVDVKTPVHSFS